MNNLVVQDYDLEHDLAYNFDEFMKLLVRKLIEQDEILLARLIKLSIKNND